MRQPLNIIRILIFLFLFIQPVSIHSQEIIPKINIEFDEGHVIDIAKNDRLLRAKVIIENYDPQYGYHFMKVTNLETGEILKISEILPLRQKDNYVAQIAYYLDTTDDLTHYVGEYELEVYSEFGNISSKEKFSIINSFNNKLSNQTNTKLDNHLDYSNSKVPETKRIPRWIQTIFVWYANGEIDEKELINALEFLIENKIIKIDIT